MIPRRFIILLGIALLMLLIGGILNQSELIPIQMTYGNFDVPGKISFVNRLLPGVPDHASLKVYDFVETNWHPLIVLIGILFPLMLFFGLYKNQDYWRDGITRVFTQWTAFVISRLGVFRAGNVWPIRRSCLGTFPFLNCQACEMTTGACPIGLLQNILIRGRLPFQLVGSMLLFGLVLGKSICGWLCPFGFISDLLDRISLHWYKLPRSLSYVRYWALAFVIIGPLVYLAFGATEINFFCASICGSGKILGLLPYYVTTATPTTLSDEVWNNPQSIVLFSQIGLTLGLLIAMLLISGRVFCRVVCPLGGFWGLFYPVSLAGIQHEKKYCRGCGACETVCPMGVSRSFSGFIDRTSCMSCGRCIRKCSSGARRFRWGFEPEVIREEKVIETGQGYGSLYNRLRRDFYLLTMSLLARSPIGMARYAYDQTKFYNRHYGNPPEEFASLPLVLKSEIGNMDPYDLLSRDMADSVAWYGETTGSTGFPTPAFLTEREFHAARVISKITPHVSSIDRVLSNNRAIINGLTFGFTIAGMSFGDLLMNHGGMVANVGTRSTIATPERMARAFNRLRPSVLTGTPIDLLCWARILKEDYPKEATSILEELKIFISTAELCAGSRSKAIMKEFDLLHIDVYACVEGFFSVPCPCGEKHVLPIYHTELCDDDRKITGVYGEGRLIFTNLLKKSTPLVRYLLDDFVTLFPSKCPHGFARSVEPHGRWELTVLVNNKRLGVRHFEEAIFRHGLFGDYRVVLNDEVIEVTVEEYGAHDSGKEMEDRLSTEFGMKTSVKIVPFGIITNYREVRRSKPILKVEDKRSGSTQKIPEYL
ncbi:MAG: 4Fe-4S binding protein [Candidatus Riflebacteria bacterium]|nr:4Fe-4S binding protein [Candidatus Riflebacteria bacterium]